MTLEMAKKLQVGETLDLFSADHDIRMKVTVARLPNNSEIPIIMVKDENGVPFPAPIEWLTQINS